MMRGLIHVYTGDGKGKTTAAVGLGLRCAGCGRRVRMAQFLKNTPSGELDALQAINGFSVIRADTNVKGFVWELDSGSLSQLQADTRRLFDAVTADCGGLDMLILDEIFGVLSDGFIAEDRLVAFLAEKPEALEVVLTGRNAPQEIIEIADYVSELRCIKHPMDRGIPARRGIEF